MFATLLLGGVANINAHGLELSVEQFADTDIAMVVEGRSLTIGQLKTLLGMRSARYRPGMNITYGLDEILDQGRQFPVYTRLAAEAAGIGIELDPEELELVERETRAHLRELIFFREVVAKVPNPTLDELRSLYEALKDVYYKTPERYLIQSITIPYVDDGSIALETLERVGREVSNGRALRSTLSEEGLSARAYVLEPQSESERELGILLKEIPDRSCLDPINEGQAWVLYYRQLGMPASHLPFQSCLESLRVHHFQHGRSVALTVYLEDALLSGGLLTIVEANLLAAPQLALDSDVLAYVAGNPVTRGELRASVGWRLNLANASNLDHFRHLLLESGFVQELLMDHLAQSLNFAADSETAFFEEEFAKTLLVRKFLLDDLRRNAAPVKSDEVVTFWRNMRAETGSMPGGVLYDRILARSSFADTPLFTEMMDSRDYEAFRRRANQLMNSDSSAMWYAGMTGHLSALPELILPLIQDFKSPFAHHELDGERLHLRFIRSANPDALPSEAEYATMREKLEMNALQETMEQAMRTRAASIEYNILIPIASY